MREADIQQGALGGTRPRVIQNRIPLTGIVIFFFLLAAVLAALGLADQRKLYWRFTAWRFRNPSANEPSGAAFAWQRGVLFAAAAVMVFQGCKALGFADSNSWSGNELRQAVNKAASAMEEETEIDSPSDDYSDLIESKVTDAGQNMGPSYAVDVEAAEPGEDGYVITADGTDAVFCMRISQTESDEGGFVVLGVGDQPGSYVPAYALKATVDEGRC